LRLTTGKIYTDEVHPKVVGSIRRDELPSDKSEQAPLLRKPENESFRAFSL
jgi:hypothetical protein